MSILELVKEMLPTDYDDVKADPLFFHIMAIHDNGLGYSGKVIHSMMCKQLQTSKLHELWFVFARRPMRFSLQEFHAVTGLKIEKEDNCNIDEWVDDEGFWSKLLNAEGRSICIQDIRKVHILDAKNWKRVDRLCLVYLCVIGGLLCPMDEKAVMPHTYIKLVMDFGKLRTYPWGLESFDQLLKAMKTAREKLTRPISYPLHGFSFAFQIWIMEAIPDMGDMLGQKLNKDDIVFPRCSNWIGASKISYPQINQLESSFGSEAILYPFISSTGNADVIKHVQFTRTSEMRDERVDNIISLIKDEKDWSDHIWEVKPPNQKHVSHEVDIENDIADAVADVSTPKADDSSASTSRRAKKKFSDPGVEERKQKLLCQRSAGKSVGVNEDLKYFITGLFESSFTSMSKKVEKMEKDINLRFANMESEFTILKDAVSEATVAISSGQRSTVTTATTVNVEKQPQEARKDDNKDGVDCKFSFDGLHDVALTQTCNMELELGTQEYLQKTLGRLSQASVVHGFDPSQSSKAKMEDDIDWLSPLSSFPSVKKESVEPHTRSWLRQLTPKELENMSRNAADATLVFHEEEEFKEMQDWSMAFELKELHVGPLALTLEVLTRIISSTSWLHTPEVDAVMFLFREKTSLRRWKPDRVGFMTCSFSSHIKVVYREFLAEKKAFKLSTLLLAFGKGDLPAHGKTGRLWDVDVDRLYVPVNVNSNHWISLCISFKQRAIHVFDCGNGKHAKDVEPFATIIPRIVHKVQAPGNNKHLKIKPYTVTYVKMKDGLNRSHCHCGVYALKYIECHLLGLDFSLMDDSNIKGARFRIAIDLYQAANDQVLIDRLSKYEPPEAHIDSTIVDIG